MAVSLNKFGPTDVRQRSNPPVPAHLTTNNVSTTPESAAAEAVAREDMLLVERCQRGDSTAYEILVNRYRGRIYAMTFNLTGNESDAWDLAQEVFIKAWRALPKFEARAAFFTWLYRITHNVTYDFLRKKRITAGGEEFDDSEATINAAPGASTVPAGELRPDQGMEQKELGERIREALAKLSPEHRAAIVAKEVDGLSYQEIAESQNITMGTVMSRLYYARQKLQNLLQDLAPQPN
jgi:RNA polymerase sigma-70 factor, ECF subfamily